MGAAKARRRSRHHRRQERGAARGQFGGLAVVADRGGNDFVGRVVGARDSVSVRNDLEVQSEQGQRLGAADHVALISCCDDIDITTNGIDIAKNDMSTLLSRRAYAGGNIVRCFKLFLATLIG